MDYFSEVTRMKISILEEGVKFKPLSLFSDIIKKINFILDILMIRDCYLGFCGYTSLNSNVYL